MKVFWTVLAAGLALMGFSAGASYLGLLASQRSDVGIVVGGLCVVVLIAVAATVAMKFITKARVRATSEDNK